MFFVSFFLSDCPVVTISRGILMLFTPFFLHQSIVTHRPPNGFKTPSKWLQIPQMASNPHQNCFKPLPRWLQISTTMASNRPHRKHLKSPPKWLQIPIKYLQIPTKWLQIPTKWLQLNPHQNGFKSPPEWLQIVTTDAESKKDTNNTRQIKTILFYCLQRYG